MKFPSKIDKVHTVESGEESLKKIVILSFNFPVIKKIIILLIRGYLLRKNPQIHSKDVKMLNSVPQMSMTALEEKSGGYEKMCWNHPPKLGCACIIVGIFLSGAMESSCFHFLSLQIQQVQSAELLSVRGTCANMETNNQHTPNRSVWRVCHNMSYRYR